MGRGMKLNGREDRKQNRVDQVEGKPEREGWKSGGKGSGGQVSLAHARDLGWGRLQGVYECDSS